MILLDTCVISELTRPLPEPAVVAWLRRQDSESLHLSVITVAEVARGCAQLADGRRKQELRRWLDDLRLAYRERIVPFDEPAALRWAEVSATCRREGRTVPLFDGFIGATAWRHGFAIATRNIEDFQSAGVDVIDPWKGTT